MAVSNYLDDSRNGRRHPPPAWLQQPCPEVPQCQLPPPPTASAQRLAPSAKTLLPSLVTPRTSVLKPCLQSYVEIAMPLAFSSGICQYNASLSSTSWKQIYVFTSRMFRSSSVSKPTARSKSTTISEPNFRNPALTHCLQIS